MKEATRLSLSLAALQRELSVWELAGREELSWLNQDPVYHLYLHTLRVRIQKLLEEDNMPISQSVGQQQISSSPKA